MPLILSGDTGVPASGMPAGSVIQTVTATSYAATSSSAGGYVTVGLSVSITPISTSSKILIFVNGGNLDSQSTGRQIYSTILRNGTALNTSGSGMADAYSSSGRVLTPVVMTYLDSPSTTSSITYAAAMYSGGNAIVFNSQNDLMSITVQEIKG